MPEWRSEIRRRLEPLSLTAAREVDIVEEIGQHLDERYQRARALGASEAEAAERAWHELESEGTLSRALAQVEPAATEPLPPPGAYRQRGWSRGLWQDARYAARTLRRSPTFSAAVLLAVAFSVGPVTAIVSVGDWLLWRPLAGVADPRSLAMVWFGSWQDAPNGGVSFSPAGVSYENLEDLEARSRVIGGIAGVQESTASLSVAGRPPVAAETATVTTNFFDVLGVRLSAGRSFLPEEDRGAFGAPVVVISETLARVAFGSAGAAVGKSVTLNSRPFTVIGVANAAFGGTSNEGGVDAWLTRATWSYLNHVKQPRPATREDGMFYEFVVRLAPGATFAALDHELKTLTRQLADAYPTANAKFLKAEPRVFPGLGLRPLQREPMRRTMTTLLAVGGVLLLLGCANVANLLVFRAARRAPEIAVRKALGASLLRLLQLQVMESWLLSVGGAALGLVLAMYLKQLIERLLFPRAPGLEIAVPMDLRVLSATIVAAIATGTVAALAPGWLLARTRGLAALARATVTWSRAPRLRGGLAVAQLSLSLTLLVGALLLVSTLRNLHAVDIGFDPDRVAVVSFDLAAHGYDRPRAMGYHRSVLPALQAAGFEAVSLSALAPFGSSWRDRMVPEGGDQERPLMVVGNGVGAGYFRLLSIPIVRGRAFTEDEASDTGSEPAVIVNEALARQLFGRVDVVGRTVRILDPTRDLRVIGVAGDSHWRAIDGDSTPIVYHPFAHFQIGMTRGVYLIKTGLPPERTGLLATAIAARTASAVPLGAAQPLGMSIDRALSRQRVFAWMFSLLAALGFVLAALGLYGLVAQATIERRREFGIRLALGAARRTVILAVARSAAVIASIGLAVGLPLAYLGTRLIRRLLFGVSPLDPAAYLAATATLAAVVALACIGPAWRAVRVRPVEVLRAE